MKHLFQKLFATKITTPCRDSLEEVTNDIEHLRSEYDKIGMILIDIKYKEHVSISNSIDNDHNIWRNKKYMSYAKLYFIKGTI